jgi:hypothetical protein
MSPRSSITSFLLEKTRMYNYCPMTLMKLWTSFNNNFFTNNESSSILHISPIKENKNVQLVSSDSNEVVDLIQ